MRFRQPIPITWTIPGLVYLGTLAGKYTIAEMIGANLMAGILIILLGLMGVGARIMAWLPLPIVMGMFAGSIMDYITRMVSATVTDALVAGVTVAAFLLGRDGREVGRMPVADEAARVPSDQLVNQIITTTRRQRPRPRWLASIQESPMHAHARVVVGSPTRRLTFAVALLLLAALIAAGIAGAFLLHQFHRLRYGASGHHFIVHNDHVAVLYFTDQGEGFRLAVVPLTALFDERDGHIHIRRVVAALLGKAQVHGNNHRVGHGRAHMSIDMLDQ